MMPTSLFADGWWNALVTSNPTLLAVSSGLNIFSIVLIVSAVLALTTVPIFTRRYLREVAITGGVLFLIFTGIMLFVEGAWHQFHNSAADFFGHWLTQNLLLIISLGTIARLIIRGARSERWERAWNRFRKDRTGVIALVVVCIYIFIGALETFRLPVGEHGANKSLLDMIFAGVPGERSYSAPLANSLVTDSKPTPDPLNSSLHLLGTDNLGKDVLLQTLKACRTALLIGGFTSAIYIPLGALLGILAGYFRKWTDDIIQYFYSVLASIPEILLLVSILFVLGPGIGTISIALGITGWVGLCRLIRGETMRQSERSYVAAARSLGQGHWQIISRHLLPNVMHLVIINFVLGFSNFILAEAVLSYLGVGCPVGTASWGVMIDGARSELSRSPVVWWNLAAAATALFGLVLALNLLGDSLRRAFDPKRS